MSDGRAAVLCLFCSLSLFILFWFSMCFRYIVYSYISPSLFLSCSFASFCSPSKSHKVSLFLFFLLLLTLRGSFPWRAVSIGQGTTSGSRFGQCCPLPAQVQPCASTYVCLTVSVSVLWLHSPRDGENLHTALKYPWGCPKGTLGAEQEPISALKPPSAQTQP